MQGSAVARVAPLAISLAALIANQRAPTAPIAWSDTIYDQSHVDRCMADDRCTLIGTATSIPGLFHAVVWLDVRTLLHWLGVRPTGLLRTVLVLNALTAAIVFQLASRLGGLLAGAIATIVLVFGIDLGFPVDAVHNLSVLPFLGAVLTVACSAVVAAPGVATVALAALVAAVMANIHVVCVLTGASVVWTALAARRRRLGLAAVAAIVFTVATVGFAPSSWQQNLLVLLGGSESAGGPATVAPSWPRMDVAGWSLLAVAIWGGSLLTRAPAWAAARRDSIGALAIVVPTLTAALIAPAFGVRTEAKYLIPVHAACATAVGLALGRLAQTVVSTELSPAIGRIVELASPFAVAVAVALGATLAVEHPEQAMTLDDLAAAAHLLRAEERWDDRHIVRAFSTPERADALTGLLQHLAADAPPRSAGDGADDTAMLINLKEDELPDPLPPTWRVLRRSASKVSVLVLSRARLDWRRFELCVPGPNERTARCNPVTWDGLDPRRDAVNRLPHMPPAGVRWTGVLRLRVPLLRQTSAAPGAVFMPRGSLCGGRIAAVRGITSTITDDRRRVTFGPPGTEPADVELEWTVGAPECDVLQYDGFPPFIIEGKATDVDLLEQAFRRREHDAASVGAPS
jgi:hypothetical protein